MNVSDLVPSASTNVEEVFVGDLSPIKTSSTTSMEGFSSVIYFSFVH